MDSNQIQSELQHLYKLIDRMSTEGGESRRRVQDIARELDIQQQRLEYILKKLEGCRNPICAQKDESK